MRSFERRLGIWLPQESVSVVVEESIEQRVNVTIQELLFAERV
jgi:hypothetical protein